MSPDEATLPDDQLAEALSAYDDVLAAGVPVDFSSELSTSPELQERLGRNLACMQMLRRHWPGPAFEANSAGAGDGLGPSVRLGHFQIRRELGRGGYGVVFLAQDLQLGREVALKIPRTDLLASAELRARFRQEARAAAGLDHPNIVPVYEAGEAGPVYYIASAYCPGITLAEWLKRQAEPVPFRLAATLLAGLADGVQHAHSRGVLHRDLKPANIILQEQNEECRMKNEEPSPSDTVTKKDDFFILHSSFFIPKITDFGLAKLLQEESTNPSLGYVTQSGAIVGTPNYMAPEQARGQTKQITTATDIYALGVILYEILTGRPPFQGATPLETLRQIESTEPVPPSRIRAKLPADLETICLKCLEKDPPRRYVSAAALAEDLRHFVAGEPIRARPIGVWEWSVKWARRRPERAALAGVIAAAAISLLVGALWYSARLAKALQTAEQRRVEADQNFALARQAVEDYLTKVSENKRLTESDFHPLRKELLQAALPFYEQFVREAESDPARRADQGRAHERLGKVHHVLGEIEKALANYREMQTIFAELGNVYPDAPEYRRCLGQAYNDLGDALQKLGREDEAEQSHARAQALQRELAVEYPAVALYRRDLGFSHFSRASVLEELGRKDEAEKEYRESMKVHEQLARDFPSVPDYRRMLAWSHNNLANDVLAQTGRYKEAEQEIRMALALKEQLVRDSPLDPEYHVSVANSHAALSNLFHRQRLHEHAESQRRRAIAILEDMVRKFPSVPDYQSRLAGSYDNLGNVLRDLGRRPESKEQYQRALAFYQRLAAEHPDIAEHTWGVANTRALLAWLLAEYGNYRQAAADLSRIDERTAGSGMARYNTACGWAVAHAAVLRETHLAPAEREKLADEYAALSLQWLKKAAEAGYFRDGANLDWLDLELAPALRTRPDFQGFVKELDQRMSAK
jgi:serine/threonine protein kinase/tetratricopeptide (TPR) repeat protein